MINKKNTSYKKALLAARYASEKKGHDIVLMDMRTISSVCDWFVLVSARSTPGIKAVVRAIDEGLTREGINYHRREGQYEQKWVVLDYGDVVIHAFLPEIRGFYGLETLWKDIPREEYDDKCEKKTSRKRSERSP